MVVRVVSDGAERRAVMNRGAKWCGIACIGAHLCEMVRSVSLLEGA